MRGIFVEPSRKNSNSSNESTSKRSKYNQSTAATLRKQEPERTETKIGRIELVKDVKSGTYLNLDEALEAEIINFETYYTFVLYFNFLGATRLIYKKE